MNVSPEVGRKVWLDPYFIISLVITVIIGLLSARAASREAQGIYSVSRK